RRAIFRDPQLRLIAVHVQDTRDWPGPHTKLGGERFRASERSWQPRRMGEKEHSYGDEGDSGHAGRRLTVTTDLLIDHQRRERGHPPEHRGPQSERHEHQGPAAAETEDPMPESEPERSTFAAAIVPEEVRRRVAALRKTLVLQAGELKDTCQGKD